MLGVRLAAPVAERRRGIREVELDALHARAEDRDQSAGLRVLRHCSERVRFDLQVPRVVDVPGLKESARRGLRVATALERDRLEERLVRIAEVVIEVVR